MVWKQDLAQLKQQLKPDQEPPGPPPKPVSPLLPPQSLEESDLLFLQAMGGVAVPPTPTASSIVKETEIESSSSTSSSSVSNSGSKALSTEESSSDFSQALGDLKGLRPLPKNPVFSAAGPSRAPSREGTIPHSQEVRTTLPSPTPKTEDPPSHHSEPDPIAEDMAIAAQPAPHVRSGPVLMHLAAGMAIEVDGTLDLRRHSLNDAKDRLKERIRDGLALHWRTLLVTLGPSEALKQGFLAFLTTPQAQLISRYAQAPIPMGGAQAWVLYLNQPVQPLHKPLQHNNLDITNGGPA